MHFQKTFLKRVPLFSFIFILLFFSACQSETKNILDGEEKQVITITTGGTTGPYFAVGNGMVDLFEQYIPDTIHSVRSSGGGVENIRLLLEGKAELGLVMADIASFAYNGKPKLGGLKNGQNLRAVTALYPNFVHIISLKENGITTIDDLKGKRVGVGDVGSGTEVNARTILEAYGIFYQDIEEHYLSYRESVIELRNGNIDAAFLTSGLHNSMILELAETDDVQFIPIAKEKVETIAEKFPYYSHDFIPKQIYKNDQPISTAAITNLLLTREDVSEDLIYNVTKIIFLNIDRLHQSHPAAVDIRLENGLNGLTVPLHNGSKKFFEEHSE